MRVRRVGFGTAVVCLAIGGPASAAELASEHPRGTYVKVPPVVDDEAAPGDPSEGGGPLILYLNRCEGGETISQGQDNSSANTSSIIGGSVNFPPFGYGDQAWNEVVDHARAIFSPFNIQVTDVDPGATAHDEAIVCGSGENAGFGGAGGVAPFSCGVIPRAITFTFPDSLGGDPRTIAEVIGQEAAHAWGLDHEYLCEDPMTYLSGCGDKTFQDQDVSCGEYEPRACSCGGATQNSYQHIMDAFGAATPDTQAPTAAITYPQDGDAFEVGADFDVTVEANDDVAVVSVTLFANGQAAEDIAAPWGPWPANDTPEGMHEFYISVVDAAGNQTQSDVVTIHVTADGMPPAGETGDPPAGESGSEGGESGDPDGGEAGGGVDDDDGQDSSPWGETEDALPPGFGGGALTPTSCACSTTRGPGIAWSLLTLFGLLRLRRRR